MKLINSKELAPGMSAGDDVTAEGGRLKLLAKGTRVTPAQIAGIEKWGVPVVCVKDETAKRKDETAKRKDESDGVSLPQSDFLEMYTETLDGIVRAFDRIRKFKEVPLLQMRELADSRIALIAETVGAIEYLHKIQRHSSHTFQHSLNVAVIAGILGRWCGFQGIELKNLILAGLLHDIGKLFVPLAILDKPAGLTPDEFGIIKRHSQEGYWLVEASNEITDMVKQGILQHHERLDGSGYPNGLAGCEISDGAKVIAVADIYEAMTADRAYRSKVTPLTALEDIAGQMFVKLDPDICMIFLNKMRDHLTGCDVMLNTGQKAKIVAFPVQNWYFTKPAVCLSDGTLIDLQTTAARILELC